MRRIESPGNPKVKAAARLRERRVRARTGRFLVEGGREVRRAIEAGHVPERLFLREELADAPTRAAAERAARAGAAVHSVSAAAYERIAMREGSDGVVGVFPIPDARPGRLRLPREGLLLAAVGIEKPGNLGALLRSADAFGAAAFLVEGGTDLWNPAVVRASLGCLFTVPVAAFPPGDLLPWLARRGLRIAAATPDGETDLADADLTGPLAIVVGSEERGLAAGERRAADLRLRIPMRGRADSLNVAVAAGVLLWEAVRQRSRPGRRPGGA